MMAKCLICNSKKGKRKCLISDGFICSYCCGLIRQADQCSGCPYYQAPKRKYQEIPRYSIQEMETDLDLQSYSNAIESALCAYDANLADPLHDNEAIKIIERLLDKYYFNDDSIQESNSRILNGFYELDKVVYEDLKDIDNQILVQILALIWFVARRRTKFEREYMTFIQKYVGPRIAPGVRVVNYKDLGF